MMFSSLSRYSAIFVVAQSLSPSLRAKRSNPALSQQEKSWIASLQALLAMTLGRRHLPAAISFAAWPSMFFRASSSNGSLTNFPMPALGSFCCYCTSIIRHGREALNQNRPGGPHAVSNHDRRLAAEAGMAGRTQHAMGALEIVGRGTGA